MQKIQISRIDENGLYLEPVLATQNEIDRHLNADDEFTLGNVVIEEVPEGFHAPKFDGTAWVEGKPDTELLENRKASKKSEFNILCEKSIVEGFTAANGHHYRTNRDDQTNMIGQYNALVADSTITSVNWKTENAGYIAHTRDEWLTVYQEAFTHKQTQLFKYDNLKKQIDACLTITEVEAIVW